MTTQSNLLYVHIYIWLYMCIGIITCLSVLLAGHLQWQQEPSPTSPTMIVSTEVYEFFVPMWSLLFTCLSDDAAGDFNILRLSTWNQWSPVQWPQKMFRLQLLTAKTQHINRKPHMHKHTHTHISSIVNIKRYIYIHTFSHVFTWYTFNKKTHINIHKHHIMHVSSHILRIINLYHDIM